MKAKGNQISKLINESGVFMNTDNKWEILVMCYIPWLLETIQRLLLIAVEVNSEMVLRLKISMARHISCHQV